MNIEQAYSLLGVTPEDDYKTIKMRYRKLMSAYHPDAVGSDAPEHLRMAQQLNEAYTLLQRRAKSNDAQAKSVWKGKRNHAAYVERDILMPGLLFDEEHIDYYKVARGCYYWNPDREEFELFLRSINLAVMDLLEELERRNEIYNDYEYDIRELRFQYQIKLFHLLVMQYIEPWECLQKLAEPENTENDRDIYLFQTFLGTRERGAVLRALAALQTEETIYIKSIQNNRMIMMNGDGVELGHLAFAEDAMYYVVIPILQTRKAQVKFVVQEREICEQKRAYKAKVNVDMYLRVERKMYAEQTRENAGAQNEQIKAALREYEGRLKT